MSIVIQNTAYGDFIDRNSAIGMLQTMPTYMQKITSIFNIATFYKERKLYYKVQDLQRAIDEVELFHSKHYPAAYTFDKLGSRFAARDIEAVTIPPHYLYILKQKYIIPSNSRFYKKDDVDKLLASKPNLDGFIDRNSAINILESNDELIADAVNGFNIYNIKVGNKLYYKFEDIQKAITEVEIFHSKHLSSQYVYENLFSKWEMRDIENIQMPAHYRLILRNKYPLIINGGFYTKEAIDRLIASKPNLDNFIDRDSAINMLQVNQDNLVFLLKEFNIETIKQAQKMYYKLEDIQRVIDEVESFHATHYTAKYVYDNILKKSDAQKLNIQYANIPYSYKLILKDKYPLNPRSQFYRKEDVDRLSTLNGFIDKSTFLMKIEVDNPSFNLKPIVDGFNIETRVLSNGIFYKLVDIERAIEEVTQFFTFHYTYNQSCAIVGDSWIRSNNLKSIDIPKHYAMILNKTFDKKFATTVYKKTDIEHIDTLKKEYHNTLVQIKAKKEQKEQLNDTIRKEYVPKTKALEMLSFSQKSHHTFQTIVEQNQLRVIKGSSYYYNIEDINKIINKREAFFKEYIPIGKKTSEYFRMYNISPRHRPSELTKYDIPPYCNGLANEYGNSYMSSGAYKLSDLEAYCVDFNNRRDRVIRTNLMGNTNFDTFLVRLESHVDWKGFRPDTEYTHIKLYNYVSERLCRDFGTKTLNSYIIKSIRLSISVQDILDKFNVSEIYLLSSSQINLHLRSICEPTYKEEFYKFLLSVNVDLRMINASSKLAFNIDKIDDPRKANNKNWDDVIKKDLYDFDVYSKVFNYLIDIDMHVSKIIEEARSNDSIVHASIWLYTMLHLNNAWRNGDCTRFPQLLIKDLIDEYQIKEIEWFGTNKLTLPQSKAIVFRVRQWEMRMSKTKMKGVFFCSDELSPAFATAVIILHVYKYKHSIAVIEQDIDNNLIMNFGTNDNDVSKTDLKNFFKPANIKKFTFSSRKFNKSIMTYIYILANLKDDNKAFVYAQKLRQHMHLSSTAHYVDFHPNKVESLGRQLFTRGEFGYIPALLAQKVLGPGQTGSFEEMTNQLMLVSNVFGDIHQMNTTAKFINNIRIRNIINSERQEVANMLANKTFEECQLLYTEMCTMSLPSKDDTDIQCLFSHEGCQMPNLDGTDKCSCFDCPYHIPSIYALTKLCNSLTDNYKMYLGLPEKISLRDFKKYLLENPNAQSPLNRMRKMQIGLKIERRRLLLAEAIGKYGKEYVYRCLDIDRETFIDLADIVRLDFFEHYPELLLF